MIFFLSILFADLSATVWSQLVLWHIMRPSITHTWNNKGQNWSTLASHQKVSYTAPICFISDKSVFFCCCHSHSGCFQSLKGRELKVWINHLKLMGSCKSRSSTYAAGMLAASLTQNMVSFIKTWFLVTFSESVTWTQSLKKTVCSWLASCPRRFSLLMFKEHAL